MSGASGVIFGAQLDPLPDLTVTDRGLGDDVEMCESEGPAGFYRCTMPPDHLGLCQAGDGDTTLAVWAPNQPEEKGGER